MLLLTRWHVFDGTRKDEGDICGFLFILRIKPVEAHYTNLGLLYLLTIPIAGLR